MGEGVVAEGAGFEPAIRFPVYTLSKRAPSATRPPLHILNDYTKITYPSSSSYYYY